LRIGGRLCGVYLAQLVDSPKSVSDDRLYLINKQMKNILTVFLSVVITLALVYFVFLPGRVDDARGSVVIDRVNSHAATSTYIYS